MLLLAVPSLPVTVTFFWEVVFLLMPFLGSLKGPGIPIPTLGPRPASFLPYLLYPEDPALNLPIFSWLGTASFSLTD